MECTNTQMEKYFYSCNKNTYVDSGEIFYGWNKNTYMERYFMVVIHKYLNGEIFFMAGIHKSLNGEIFLWLEHTHT